MASQDDVVAETNHLSAIGVLRVRAKHFGEEADKLDHDAERLRGELAEAETGARSFRSRAASIRITLALLEELPE